MPEFKLFCEPLMTSMVEKQKGGNAHDTEEYCRAAEPAATDVF